MRAPLIQRPNRLLFCALCVVAAVAACSLNPQPLPPGDYSGSAGLGPDASLAADGGSASAADGSAPAPGDGGSTDSGDTARDAVSDAPADALFDANPDGGD